MADTLKDAYQLFSKRRYSDVIKILEPQVFRFRDNFNFYYILGMSCLNQGDYGGAFSYLRRAVDLREDDVNTLLGIAAVYLKRGDTGNAIRIWLDIVELDPGNVSAARGLNYLRKNNDADEFTGMASQDKIVKFLPQPGFKKTFKPAFLIIPLLLIITVTFIIPASRVYLIDLIRDTVFSSGSKANNRPEIPEITLDARKDFINLNGGYTYILTEQEIEEKLNNIQDYLYEFRDNIAQREINKILLSNASEYVKERARLLSKYVAKPNLSEFKDNFSYADVIASPHLYEGCFVLWKGKATNVSETTEKISFDFLVGYHEEKTLDGIVPGRFNFAIKIVPDQPIGLLGKIILDETFGLILQGEAIHRL
jgi:tetratricopeptide (TPR) repeat protein